MHLIRHYDEGSGIEFEIPEFNPVGYPDLADFLQAHHFEINAAILAGLHSALDLRLAWVPTFAVKGVDQVFGIAESEYRRQVDRLLEYYVELEEFEICVILKEFKEAL